MSSSADIYLFNRVYPPALQATATLVGELAEGLASDFRVTVVCNEPRGTAARPPDGPVRVRSGPAPQARRRTLAVRAIEYVQALFWAAMNAMTIDAKATAIVWTDPPLMETLIGAILVLRGVRYVQVIQDFHLLMLSRKGYWGRVAAGIWWAIQRPVFARADRIVCISDDTRQVLRARGLRRPLDVIENWCANEEEFTTLKPGARSGGLPVAIHYSGNIGLACDLDTFARSLVLLSRPELVRFVFRGNGVRIGTVRALANRYPNVTIAERVAESLVASTLAAVDAQLILTPTLCYGAVFPSKLYTAMAVGRPVIVSAPAASSIHALVRDVGCGLTAASEDPAQLADAIERLISLSENDPRVLADMGRRGMEYILGPGSRASALVRWRALVRGIRLGDDATKAERAAS